MAKRGRDDRLFFSEAVLAVDPAAPASTSAPLPSGWNVQPVLPTEDIPTPPSSTSSTPVTTPLPSPSDTSSALPPSPPSPRRRGRPRLIKKSLISHYDDVRLEPGLLLIAHPAWQFHPFTQSVILNTHHDEETGSEGVIINRPLGGLVKLDGTDDIERSVLHLYRRYLTQLQGMASDGAGVGTGAGGGGGTGQVAGPPLLYGGPVTGLRCLHRLDGFADVSKELIGGEWPVYAGELPFWEKVHTTLVDVEQRTAEGPKGGEAEGGGGSGASAAADVELFLGRCVWQAGQLRAELRTGIWLLCKGSGVHVFTQPKQAKLTSYPSASPTQSSSPSSAIPLTPSSPTPSSPPSPLFPSPAPTLFASHVPSITFPWQHIWAHCVWQLGGEWRSMAQVEEVKGSRGLEGMPGEVKGKERGGQRAKKREEVERWDDTGSNMP